MTHMSRRMFVGGVVGAGLTVGAGVGLPAVIGSGSTGHLVRSQLKLPAPYKLPLPIPPVARPVSSGSDHDSYRMVQREAIAEILPGVQTPIWGYDGRFPGPTIVSRSGRRTEVEHDNQLPVPTVVHLHGARTPAESDGYPTDLVLPRNGWAASAPMGDQLAKLTRGSRRYVYPLQQPAATLWYHDHRMDFTGPAVYRGLAGFHLVSDDHEQGLGLPSGVRDLPLAIADRAFAADGQFAYPSKDPTLTRTPGVRETYIEGVFGDVILVNGAPWPEHPVDAARYRLRILNASNARRYDLAFRVDGKPVPFVQIGADQGLLDRPREHQHLVIAPAERFDLVIDFAKVRVGAKVELVNSLGRGTTSRVMRFNVVRRAADESRIPAALRQIQPLQRSDATVTREFSFRAGKVHGGHAGWVINGRPFAPDYFAAEPRLGAVEIWRFITDLHHPIHLHQVGFQVLSRGGKPPGAFDTGVKDTIDLRPGEAAEVITRFDAYRGRFVFHCHNSEHEDMAMMANFKVI
ncbi:multicopper oxidase family protein [Flexivirga aerilata]|nr:multicopper oxidase domain-containing protein [Flexivirga aerilata]